MLTVRVVFGSGLSRLAGIDAAAVQLATPTLTGLAQALSDSYGKSLADALGGSQQRIALGEVAILVNGVSANSETVLHEGDEVALFFVAAGG